MIDIETLKQKNTKDMITLTDHARLRLYERGISIKDIVKCIDVGKKIKQYEDDKPLPSCLLLGISTENKSIHIVVSTDEEFIYLITAYFPDMELWEEDFRTRKGC